MNRLSKISVAALAAFVVAGCVDLEIMNPNAADAERALSTDTDIEALIGGGWRSWWNCSSSSNGPGPILMTMAYQHSATAANFGMVEFSGWPKTAAHAAPSNVYYGNNVGYCWTQLYRGVSAVVDGLKALEGGAVTLPADRLARVNAFGYFVLGLAHGSAALLYDQGYIYDPTISVDDVSLQPHGDVMTAALGYLDQAIAAASGQSFTIPGTWMSRDVSAAELARLAYSYKARFRANVARTPTERAAVNWASVIADVDKGITETWEVDVRSATGFSSGTLVNIHRYGAWGQLTYQVLGMADGSGQYQKWLALPPDSRHPNLSVDQTSDPFLIITPDTRFPQGADRETQSAAANRGSLFHIYTGTGGYSVGWLRPDRGTFRWSYYRYHAQDMWLSSVTRTDQPEFTLAEARLLKAEGLLRTGSQGGAAAIVNETRTAAGLNATDAAGTNTSCVPKLPSGQCGSLLEMLKWEVRLETMYKGLNMAPWYFHGRGWGDLAEGVALQLPAPGRELEILGMPSYTFGGPGGESAAPVGTYGY
ncbi:MAG TPA: hypothetical protein VGA70_02200 [Longimicrobiales bacterium]|jgi:hypothetical protein